MYTTLSWVMIIICCVAVVCAKLTDMVASISWWIKKNFRKRSEFLDLSIKILDSLSNELKVKIKCPYVSCRFFEFKYMNNKFQLYVSEYHEFIGITNLTNNKYKSVEHSSKHLYLELVSFVKSSIAR